MKKTLLTTTALLLGICSFSQNQNIVQFPKMEKSSCRKEIRLPDIPGFQTLKCDFHMHTIFSDGSVWPDIRVDEAWEEGLDAIAITDHIENQPSKKYVGGDHNAAFDLASVHAKEKNILLIHAGEVSRSMPPGHLNTLFITDANKLTLPDPVATLEEAKKQGAFIIWNHPGWKAQQRDTCLWMPMHQQLFEKGLINGIEVFNEYEYYPVVLGWCLSKNLAVIGTSDIHDVTSKLYDVDKGHRPMTLVFAKERSIEAIRDAMFANRTLAFFDNQLAGKEELLTALFRASVTVKPTGRTDGDNQPLYLVTNISTIPYELQTAGGIELIVPAEGSLILPIDPSWLKGVTVKNLITGPKTKLKLDL